MLRYVDQPLLRLAIQGLGNWYSQVPQQKSRHVWSLLPLKVAGAQAGAPLAYTESDDRGFMERFMLVRDGASAYPFFDPFSHTWLPAGYAHSNMSTFRKNTFMRRWGACIWDGETVVLADDYAAIFAERVLRKSGNLTRIPALSCAIWSYKKPSIEWPDDHPFRAGLPTSSSQVIDRFRKDFAFTDEREWLRIFDADSLIDTQLRVALEEE